MPRGVEVKISFKQTTHLIYFRENWQRYNSCLFKLTKQVTLNSALTHQIFLYKSYILINVMKISRIYIFFPSEHYNNSPANQLFNNFGSSQIRKDSLTICESRSNPIEPVQPDLFLWGDSCLVPQNDLRDTCLSFNSRSPSFFAMATSGRLIERVQRISQGNFFVRKLD